GGRRKARRGGAGVAVVAARDGLRRGRHRPADPNVSGHGAGPAGGAAQGRGGSRLRRGSPHGARAEGVAVGVLGAGGERRGAAVAVAVAAGTARRLRAGACGIGGGGRTATGVDAHAGTGTRMNTSFPAFRRRGYESCEWASRIERIWRTRSVLVASK